MEENQTQKALREFSEALGRAHVKYIEMLCAAFTVKRGVAPIIASSGDGSQRVTWAEAPFDGMQKFDLAAVEARIGGEELRLLAARYHLLTNVRPEDAGIRFRFEGTTQVVVEYFDRTQPQTTGSGSSPSTSSACAPPDSLPDS